ncbi:uncharacterized protein LOC109539782 isoform X1 [Dendroctonus ponderosae]|uniref:VPS9 domain-containing protein n=1 Tax=Dendroctonus ponderosae TaxID=77166 RepID=U4U6P0_DENPD|nr:uncharacterized protein LOC109539782 isoform X1 [Dendroctonus ponderosae]ERL85620.1 hypothetical protein D910_03039 [Dendroctonus ponderosae]
MQSPSDLSDVGAQGRLRELSGDAQIVGRLRQALLSWDHRATPTLDGFLQDVPQAAQELAALFWPQQDLQGLQPLLEAFVHREVYDWVFGLIKPTLAAEDWRLYGLSREFCHRNGSPKQLGATFYNFVPNAAVVELSTLPTKRTPLEKLHCLQSSYDYIFAEVKGALISVIAKYSGTPLFPNSKDEKNRKNPKTPDKELELPLISNEEAAPILMAVIMKSKLFYAHSELAYIRTLGRGLLESHAHLRQIFAKFEEALERIQRQPISDAMGDQLANQMDVCETIEFVQRSAAKQPKKTIFAEETGRVARLITAATTETLNF